MTKASAYELPTDRLSTTDERGRRVYLYPADARGRYRAARSAVSAVLILVFLAMPWIRIQGHPAVLLDIPQRRFALFGLTFWAHEAPLLFFVTAAAILALFLVTAIWGRVWCGWGCPQTVFVDGVFRRIERWIEGDAVARRRLDGAPWGAEKTLKKIAKWAAFSLAALVVSHSFVAYFVGPEALAQMVRRSPGESPGAFAAMLGVFAAMLFDFGWFREQFCTVVCPYGRFQSVLMDGRSMSVAYDPVRGEPRRGVAAPGSPVGDCVNCYRCVQVCPTGIDIRRGLQMECIGCTACIDACDEVMTKLKKPKGLVRYAREAGVSARSWVYGALLTLVCAGFALTLSRREVVEVAIVRAAEAPYQEIAEGRRVLNHFKLEVSNLGFEPAQIDFSIDDPEVRVVVSNHAPSLAGGKSERADLFVELPRGAFAAGKAERQLHVVARLPGGERRQIQEVRLVGPYH